MKKASEKICSATTGVDIFAGVLMCSDSGFGPMLRGKLIENRASMTFENILKTQVSRDLRQSEHTLENNDKSSSFCYAQWHSIRLCVIRRACP
jgi:hypothetical protein